MTNQNSKEIILSTTQDDLLQWRENMALVRRLTMKGKWREGKETLKLMEDIYIKMKEEFANGEGIWVYSHNENNNASQGIQSKVASIGG